MKNRLNKNSIYNPVIILFNQNLKLYLQSKNEQTNYR